MLRKARTFEWFMKFLSILATRKVHKPYSRLFPFGGTFAAKALLLEI